MTKIGFEEEDWQTQMERMLGPDAPAVIYKFRDIMSTVTSEEYEEPAGYLQFVLSADEAKDWLHSAYKWMTDDDEVSDETIANMIWNMGLALAQIYVDNDAIDPDEFSSEATRFFLHMPDDMPELYGDDDMEDDE